MLICEKCTGRSGPASDIMEEPIFFRVGKGDTGDTGDKDAAAFMAAGPVTSSPTATSAGTRATKEEHAIKPVQANE